MSPARLAIMGLSFVCALVRAETVHATELEQSAAARALFQEGLAFAQEEKFEEAADRFRRAHALRPTPTISYNLAAALSRTGNVVESSELLRHVLRNPDTTLVQYLRNTSRRQREEDYFPARTFRKAARWLERNHKRAPFFLYIDTFDPHEPWDPPDHYTDLYDPGYKGEKVI